MEFQGGLEERQDYYVTLERESGPLLPATVNNAIWGTRQLAVAVTVPADKKLWVVDPSTR